MSLPRQIQQYQSNNKRPYNDTHDRNNNSSNHNKRNKHNNSNSSLRRSSEHFLDEWTMQSTYRCKNINHCQCRHINAKHNINNTNNACTHNNSSKTTNRTFSSMNNGNNDDHMSKNLKMCILNAFI